MTALQHGNDLGRGVPELRADGRGEFAGEPARGLALSDAVDGGIQCHQIAATVWAREIGPQAGIEVDGEGVAPVAAQVADHELAAGDAPGGEPAPQQARARSQGGAGNSFQVEEPAAHVQASTAFSGVQLSSPGRSRAAVIATAFIRSASARQEDTPRRALLRRHGALGP